MDHNDKDKQQSDSGRYERNPLAKVANLSISDDNKGHDQSAHDMRNVPQYPSIIQDFEMTPDYRSVPQGVPSHPGSIGAPHSLQTIGNDVLNTKAGGLGSTVEIKDSKSSTSVTPPNPPPVISTISSMTPITPSLKQQKDSNKGGKSRSRQTLSAPNEPFYTSPSTNFWCDLVPGQIKENVEVMFNSMTGVSYEFFPEKCRWEGVYLVSSMRCKFEINIYRRSSGGHVVEGNRLSGDSIAFMTVYRSVFNLFSEKPAVNSTWSMSRPRPPTKRKTAASDELASIKAVTAMALSPVGEAKANAAQIFSNMASDPSKHSFLVDNGCVPLLVQLLKFDFLACDQFAAIALTQLSEYAPCRQLLSTNKEFLEILLPLCSTDGNYNSTEKRRKCAQLLANISTAEKGAEHVVTSVDKKHIQSFLHNIECLQDVQQRELAELSKQPLAACT